jgi:branched-chain amino acid transport system ATP-binding protein
LTDESSTTAASGQRRRQSRHDEILQVDDVTKHFGGVAAVDRVSFGIERAAITALIGPNGAGKTTLFNLVSGFIAPETGTILFEGRSIHGKPPHAVAKRGLVRTFQITKALTKLSVLENMMLAAPDQPGERFWSVWFRARTVKERELEIRHRAMEALRVFRLDHMADEYAGTLSGGQRKLLELARALMTRPGLVLLDEPMAGVNPALGRSLLEHMRQIRDEHGVTFLYVEHDMDVVMTHSERIIVMAEGRVIADGTPADIRRNQGVIDAYLGTAGAAG